MLGMSNQTLSEIVCFLLDVPWKYIINYYPRMQLLHHSCIYNTYVKNVEEVFVYFL